MILEKRPLSEKQRAVYEYLAGQLQSGGIPPTVREICAATGIRSTSTVHGILNALEEAGYISRDSRYSRAIRLDSEYDASMVPLIGRVTAGQPILAVEEIVDYIPYPAKDASGLFALRVQGLSMRDAGILDGDIIVADKNSPCRSGDIIIGMDGEEATVKRLVIEKGGRVVFMPENPDFEPIIPKEPKGLGRVVGSWRKY